jgi:hypothetical protein
LLLNEAFYIALLCVSYFGGEKEQRYDYGGSYNIIDCETEDEVIEFGLDTISSRDSIIQAVVAGEVLKKQPIVFIVDQDNRLGKHEQEIYLVCKRTRGVKCLVGFVTLEGKVTVTQGKPVR